MQIEVGSALAYKGRQYICVEEQLINETRIAKDDSATVQSFYNLPNVRTLKLEVEPFIIGDVIQTTGERVVLECPGVDIQFIWVFVKIVNKTKEKENGQFRDQSTSGESSDHKVESIGSGDTSREGIGSPPPGEAGS